MIENESINFVKETHVALKFIHWDWTGSTGFSSVWCWFHIFREKYENIADVKIGFRNTGQSTRFFIRVSSVYLDYSNWSYIADLPVVAESISMQDLIDSAVVVADKILVTNKDEIDAKRQSF